MRQGGGHGYPWIERAIAYLSEVRAELAFRPITSSAPPAGPSLLPEILC